jgi:hypothetical protein
VDHLRLFGHMSQRRNGAAREGKGSRKSHVRILAMRVRTETQHVPERTVNVSNGFQKDPTAPTSNAMTAPSTAITLRPRDSEDRLNLAHREETCRIC